MNKQLQQNKRWIYLDVNSQLKICNNNLVKTSQLFYRKLYIQNPAYNKEDYVLNDLFFKICFPWFLFSVHHLSAVLGNG